ncbi:MAG: Maf family protein [Alphaproteobacteria bacterium]|nr:Maf family protein [Alphaproteobacteria bacterium]MCL2505880.1 Maf family protein [Alphaproteobacteria bacterium]
MNKTESKLILASSSPRRKEILQNAGISPYMTLSPHIDETVYDREKPLHIAQRLAMEKMQKTLEMKELAGLLDSCFVLCADTVAAVGRRVLPKAESQEDIKSFLRIMSGKRHHVYTSVTVHTPAGKIIQKTSDSTVIFKTLSPFEIEEYALTEEGIEKAGGYAIQGKGGVLIRYISGSYTGIMGLPIFEVMQILKGNGWK